MAAVNPDSNRIVLYNCNLDDLRVIKDIDAESPNLNTLNKIDVIRRIYLDRAIEFSSEDKRAAGMSWGGRFIFWISRNLYSWKAERVLVRMTKRIVTNYVNARDLERQAQENRDVQTVSSIKQELLRKSKIDDQPSPWLSEEQINGCVVSATKDKRNINAEDPAIKSQIAAGLRQIVSQNLQSLALPATEIFHAIFKKEEPDDILEEAAWPRFNTLATDIVQKKRDLMRVMNGDSEEARQQQAAFLIKGALAVNEEISVERALNLALKRALDSHFRSKLAAVVIPAYFDSHAKEDADARLEAIRSQKSASLNNDLNNLDTLVEEAHREIQELLQRIVQENYQNKCNKEVKKIRDAYSTFIDVLSAEQKAIFNQRWEVKVNTLLAIDPSKTAEYKKQLAEIEKTAVTFLLDRLIILQQISNRYKSALNSTLDAILALWQFNLQTDLSNLTDNASQTVPQCTLNLVQYFDLISKKDQILKDQLVKFLLFKEKFQDRQELHQKYYEKLNSYFNLHAIAFNPKLNFSELLKESIDIRSELVEAQLNGKTDVKAVKIRAYMMALKVNAMQQMITFQEKYNKALKESSAAIGLNLDNITSSNSLESMIRDTEAQIRGVEQVQKERGRSNSPEFNDHPLGLQA